MVIEDQVEGTDTNEDRFQLSLGISNTYSHSPYTNLGSNNTATQASQTDDSSLSDGLFITELLHTYKDYIILDLAAFFMNGSLYSFEVYSPNFVGK